MIYADENVWLAVVNGLRRRGWDVTTAAEEATLGRPDEAHLAFAAERGLVLLTFDDDFLSLVETDLADVDHAGVVYAEQYRRTVGELVRAVDATLRRVRGQDLTNRVLYA